MTVSSTPACRPTCRVVQQQGAYVAARAYNKLQSCTKDLSHIYEISRLSNYDNIQTVLVLDGEAYMNNNLSHVSCETEK